MSRRRVSSFLVVVLVVAGAVGWSVWRKNVTAEQVTSAAPTRVDENKNVAPELADKAVETVKAFEENARSWGVSRFDQQQAESMSIAAAIQRWRVPSDGGFAVRQAALGKIVQQSSVKMFDPYARDAAWDGTDLYSSYADYWSKQLYTIGVNPEPGSIKVTSLEKSSDGTINAVVSVRQQVVVYTPPPLDEMPKGSWMFKPSIGYYDVEDRLRLSQDGSKIIQLTDGTLRGKWFLAPLFMGFKKADRGFIDLPTAERHDASVTYRGDDFRSTHTGLYPDPLFAGSSATVQMPSMEAPQHKPITPPVNDDEQ